MLDHRVLVFTGVAALLTVTPGADTFLVLRNVLRGGRTAGVVTTLGICCGLFVHATLSALGLSIVLMQSANAYLALKWAGALYLMWLGLGSIRDAIRGGDGGWSPIEPATNDAPRGERGDPFRLRDPFLEGLANNVLNPKVAVFYLGLPPAVHRPRRPRPGQVAGPRGDPLRPGDCLARRARVLVRSRPRGPCERAGAPGAPRGLGHGAGRFRSAARVRGSGIDATGPWLVNQGTRGRKASAMTA